MNADVAVVRRRRGPGAALAPASTASVTQAATVDQIACPHDVVALGAQILRHLVEGVAPMLRQVALPELRDWHLNHKITCGDNDWLLKSSRRIDAATN